MAKKKVTTTVEEEIPEETPIDYKKDIENKSFDQIATDEPKEEVKEEVVVPVEEETETVEFDPEALKREAADLAKSEMEPLLKGETKEETAENKDKYQEYQEKFFKDNNRQPTWFEVSSFLEDQAVERVRAEQAAEVKAREEEVTKAKTVEEQNNAATNKYVEDTLNDLYASDKLPKIQDKADKDDYGMRVQKQLLTKVIEVNTQRIKDGAPPKTIKEILYEDFEIPAKEVAGADAPVNMGRGGYTPEDGEELNYTRDIAGARNSIRNIINSAFKRS